MARFDKPSTKGTQPNAAVASPRAPKRKPGPSIEDTMFFPRLRKHAKWMFVFLALVFGLGFVGFGVGAGGVGVGDIFRDGGGGDSGGVKSARKETEKTPTSAQAWRDLSIALQTEGDTDAAIGALQTAIGLDEKDPDLYRQLAGLYLAQVTRKQQAAQLAQLDAAYTAPGQNFPAAFTVKSERVLDDPIGKAINAAAAEKVSLAAAAAQTAAAGAVDAYKSVVKLLPDDPNVQIELAQTAQQIGDDTTALAAYKRFLALAPDDSQAAIVKNQVKQLEQTLASGSG